VASNFHGCNAGAFVLAIRHRERKAVDTPIAAWVALRAQPNLIRAPARQRIGTTTKRLVLSDARDRDGDRVAVRFERDLAVLTRKRSVSACSKREQADDRE
jgi:hypothetical protein